MARRRTTVSRSRSRVRAITYGSAPYRYNRGSVRNLNTVLDRLSTINRRVTRGQRRRWGEYARGAAAAGAAGIAWLQTPGATRLYNLAKNIYKDYVGDEAAKAVKQRVTHRHIHISHYEDYRSGERRQRDRRRDYF